MQKPVITTRGLRALLGGILGSPVFRVAEDKENLELLIYNMDTRGDLETRTDAQTEVEVMALYLLDKYRRLAGDAKDFADDYYAKLAFPKYGQKSAATGKPKSKDWIEHEILADPSSGYTEVRQRARHHENLEKCLSKLLEIVMSCRSTLEEKSIRKRKAEEVDRRTP